jgi:hypothetical protein
VGSYTIQADYSDTADTYAGSSDHSAQLTVNPSPVTNTSFSALSAQAGKSSAVTFTATVTPLDPENRTVTGTVVFKDGSNVFGSGTVHLVNGVAVASLTQPALTLNGHTITASYSGDSSFQTSSSAAVPQTFSATTLSSSAKTAAFGQTLLLTAHVLSLANNTSKPAGIVTFLDGTTTLGTATLSTLGKASLTLPALSPLSVGSHSLSVVYNGDATFDPSRSVPLTVVVNKASTVTRLSATAKTVAVNVPVTVTAVLAVKAPGAGTPGGSVTFLDGTTVMGAPTLQVVNGVVEAVWTGSFLTAGPHQIKAVYSGDPSCKTSTSAIWTLTVTA